MSEPTTSRVFARREIALQTTKKNVNIVRNPTLNVLLFDPPRDITRWVLEKKDDTEEEKTGQKNSKTGQKNCEKFAKNFTGVAHFHVLTPGTALSVNENCDPTVRTDMLEGLRRLSGGQNEVVFDLVGRSVQFPVVRGELVRGTWQGIYVFFDSFRLQEESINNATRKNDSKRGKLLTSAVGDGESRFRKGTPEVILACTLVQALEATCTTVNAAPQTSTVVGCPSSPGTSCTATTCSSSASLQLLRVLQGNEEDYEKSHPLPFKKKSSSSEKEEINTIFGALTMLFTHHTSASLCLREQIVKAEDTQEASPSIIERRLEKVVPDAWNDVFFEHTMEGRDDMPGHLKSTLLGCSAVVDLSAAVRTVSSTGKEGLVTRGTTTQEEANNFVATKGGPSSRASLVASSSSSRGLEAVLNEHRAEGGWGGGHARKVSAASLLYRNIGMMKNLDDGGTINFEQELFRSSNINFDPEASIGCVVRVNLRSEFSAAKGEEVRSAEKNVEEARPVEEGQQWSCFLRTSSVHVRANADSPASRDPTASTKAREERFVCADVTAVVRRAVFARKKKAFASEKSKSLVYVSCAFVPGACLFESGCGGGFGGEDTDVAYASDDALAAYEGSSSDSAEAKKTGLETGRSFSFLPSRTEHLQHLFAVPEVRLLLSRTVLLPVEGLMPAEERSVSSSSSSSSRLLLLLPACLTSSSSMVDHVDLHLVLLR